MKKILVTGANGFLGQHLAAYLQKAGLDVIAAGRGQSRLETTDAVTFAPVELTDSKAVAALLEEYRPDTIIHNAALSKPDECEADKQRCLDINVNTTKYLLEGNCDHFIYISTDFVFGENGPHDEDATPNPLNFYGESKLRAEELVMASDKKAAIVRPVFIYGKAWGNIRPTFLHWVKNNLQQNKPIKVLSDQFRTPTYVDDICSGIYTIIEKQATGSYNLAGKDILSPYEMAVKTAQALQLDASLIQNVTEATFPEPVKRPKRSGLKIDKAIRELGYNPVSFEEGIGLTFDL